MGTIESLPSTIAYAVRSISCPNLPTGPAQGGRGLNASHVQAFTRTLAWGLVTVLDGTSDRAYWVDHTLGVGTKQTTWGELVPPGTDRNLFCGLETKWCVVQFPATRMVPRPMCLCRISAFVVTQL